jgi:hypothetical protein
MRGREDPSRGDTFVPAYNEMRADRTGYDLDDDGFVREKIDCTWPAPAG